MKPLVVAISLALAAIPAAVHGGGGETKPELELAAPARAGLEVCPVGAATRITEPRRLVTTLFFVSSRSSEALEVALGAELPEDWLAVAGDSTLRLEPRERGISLASIWVPRTTQPGRYVITYSARARGESDLNAACSLAVTVLPVAKLEVGLVTAPDLVVAGEEYRASFAISNRGNTAADAHLRAETASNLPFEIDGRSLVIPPGRTTVVELRLATDPGIKKVIRDNVILIAEAADPGAEAHAAAPVEVIPRITGTEDRFERIPSVFALRGITSRNGAVRSRLQAEISGDGTVGGANRLAFLAKGPDVQRIGVLGRRDEYFLTYSAAHYEIAAGDRTYSASQLTESHRYGRGLEAKLKAGRLQAGGYTLASSPGEPRERQTAACLDYALGRLAGVGLNYLVKDTDRTRQALGVEARISTAWNTDLEAEYAAGMGDDPRRHAYYLRLRSTHERASSFLRLIRADTAYPGCFRDMEFVSGAVDVALRPTSRLDVSIRQERHNLVDFEDDPASREREYQLRLAERMALTDVSLGWRTRLHEEDESGTGLDYAENAARASVGQRFTRWNYHTALESGWTKAKGEGRTSSLQRWSASLHLRPADGQSYGCYLSYDSSRTPGKARKRTLTIGVSGSVRLGANTAVDLGLRSSDYEDGRSLESNMVDLTVSRRFRGRSTVLLRGYYRPWESGKGHDEMAVSLECGIPVGVPVGKRLGVGTVRGSVRDQATGSPLEDVILRLGAATAVTDARGHFVFPSVSKGNYHLRVDRASIGLDRITVEKCPMEVAVAGGSETALEIGVTLGAGLVGRVVLYRSSAGGSILPQGGVAGLVEDRGVPEVLLELSDGVETKRVLTDSEGRFAFTEMRPGTWTLKISESGLPPYTRLETSSIEFRPAPGETIETLVRVVPRQRQVQMLYDGGVLKEEKTRK